MIRRVLPLLLLGCISAIALDSADTALSDGPHPELADGLYAEFTTPRGVFTAELHYREVPLTTSNSCRPRVRRL